MFYGRHFDRSVIPCVRRYLAYGLSLHNLEEMMAERGISVDHAIIHCWTLPRCCHINSGMRASRVDGMA
jgi:putative transposase